MNSYCYITKSTIFVRVEDSLLLTMNNDTNINYYSNDHLVDENGIEIDLDIKIQDNKCNHNNNYNNMKTKNKKKKKNKKLSSSIDHNVDRYDGETEDFNAIFKLHSSRLFNIDYTKDKGRYLISKVKIKKGMIIFNEKVYQSISHQQQLCCACHLIVDNNCNISNNNVNVKNISSTITTEYNEDDNINTKSTSPNIINNNPYEDVSLPYDVFCSQQCKINIYEHKNFKYYLEINQNLKKYAMDSKSDLDLLRMIVKIMLLYDDTEVDKDNNSHNNNNDINLTNSEDNKGCILSDDGVTIKATSYALDFLEHHLEKQSKEWIDSLNLAISYIYHDIQKVYMNDFIIVTKSVRRYDNHHNNDNNSCARNYSLNSDDNDNYNNRNPILILQHDEDDDVTKQIYNYNSNHHNDKNKDIVVDNLDEMCKKVFDPVRALKLASIININSYGITNYARHKSSSPSPSATSLISSSHIFSEAIGFGLFPIVGLLINHSCQPNCIYIYNNSTQCMEYHAIVDIDRNVEINVAYINIYQSIVDRRKELLLNRYFYCYCNRCCNYDELEKKVTLRNSSSSSIITTSNNYCNNDYNSSKGDDKNDNNYVTKNNNKAKSKNKNLNIKNTNHDSINEEKEEHTFDIKSIFTSPSSLSSTMTTAKELSILNNQQQQYCIVADAMFNGNHCNECGKYHQTMRFYYLILTSSIFALILLI